MAKVADVLVEMLALAGRHDFTAFTPKETEHRHFRRRVLTAEWREVEGGLELWIEADAFLRHMNRVLVGTMLEVAVGRRTPAEFGALLDGRPRSMARLRSQASPDGAPR